jgi:DNA-binding HxlR family transcriptional regulator
MRSAALKNEDVMPGEVRSGQSARSNVKAELEPAGSARLSDLRKLPDLRPDRPSAVHAQEDEELLAQFSLTRIKGKSKFRILTELEHGPARLSRLCRLFPQTSREKLTQYLCDLERAGLVDRADSSSGMQQVEYSLSDPLGVAVVHLINTLARLSLIDG